MASTSTSANSAGRTRRRTWLRTLGLALALFLVVIALSSIPVVREWQLQLSDTYFHLVPAGARSPVVLVLIDDESLREQGRWPWSRTVLADLTRKLDAAAPRVIGLDILLSEPQSPAADAALRDAFAASGRAVIVDKIGMYPDGAHWIEPLPAFAQVASVGHAQAVLDRDGVCRRFPPRELTPDGARLAFAVEVARRADPGATTRFLTSYGIPAREAGAITRAAPVLIPIAFRNRSFDTISAAAVLRGANLSMLQGRPVLVGFGPTEIGDRISTPLSGELPTPGVEVHAQMLDSILAGRTLCELPLSAQAAFLLVLCVFAVLLSRRFLGWRSIGWMAVLGVGVYAAGLLMLLAGRELSPGPALLALIVGPVLAYAADLVVVERSVERQLLDLRRWLATRRPGAAPADSADLFWRLDLLHQLQNELGSVYELHETLLDSTQDLVAIFDAEGEPILRNPRFASLFPADGSELSLARLRARLLPQAPPDGSAEGEAEVNGELYAVGIVPLPPTTVSPGGGTVVRLASLRTRVELDRARGEALGFVTHELRTPLVAIQGFAEMLMHYPTAPACATAPQTIYQESRRLLELINSYLEVLRLDAGARPLRSEPVQLPEVTRRVVDLLQPIAAAGEMHLVLDDPDATPVMGDGALLGGAVLNLVSNAIKYATPGTEIHIRCAREGDESVVAVRNVGDPLCPEVIPQLFEPFYRSPETEAVQTGWGLGLAFVKRIAEKHGGAVRVRSEGGATVFEIRLPLTAVPQPVAAAKGTA